MYIIGLFSFGYLKMYLTISTQLLMTYISSDHQGISLRDGFPLQYISHILSSFFLCCTLFQCSSLKSDILIRVCCFFILDQWIFWTSLVESSVSVIWSYWSLSFVSMVINNSLSRRFLKAAYPFLLAGSVCGTSQT